MSFVRIIGSRFSAKLPLWSDRALTLAFRVFLSHRCTFHINTPPFHQNGPLYFPWRLVSTAPYPNHLKVAADIPSRPTSSFLYDSGNNALLSSHILCTHPWFSFLSFAICCAAPLYMWLQRLKPRGQMFNCEWFLTFGWAATEVIYMLLPGDLHWNLPRQLVTVTLAP